jgi:hypothetical protein
VYSLPWTMHDPGACLLPLVKPEKKWMFTSLFPSWTLVNHVHPGACAVSQVYFKSADFLPPPPVCCDSLVAETAPYFSPGGQSHDPPRQIQIQTGSRGTVWCPGRQRYSVGRMMPWRTRRPGEV